MERSVRYSWGFILVVVLGYLGWISFRRHEPPPPPIKEKPSRFLDPREGIVGVRILHFYAAAGELTRGEGVNICYGVANARAVRLMPEVERLKPTLNRCFTVSPKETTTYTLLVEGEDGRSATASFTVNVKPPAPWISMFAYHPKEIRRGEPVTLCFSTEDTVSARLEPVGMTLPPGKERCARMYPARSASYTLVAVGEDGRTDKARFKVTVR